jgi:hypothetical protein
MEVYVDLELSCVPYNQWNKWQYAQLIGYINKLTHLIKYIQKYRTPINMRRWGG